MTTSPQISPDLLTAMCDTFAAHGATLEFFGPTVDTATGVARFARLHTGTRTERVTLHKSPGLIAHLVRMDTVNGKSSAVTLASAVTLDGVRVTVHSAANLQADAEFLRKLLRERLRRMLDTLTAGLPVTLPELPEHLNAAQAGQILALVFEETLSLRSEHTITQRLKNPDGWHGTRLKPGQLEERLSDLLDTLAD